MIEFDENLRQGLPLIYECGNDDYLDKIIKEKELECQALENNR